MICHSIELNNQSSLIKDYRNREESIYTHFHYDPYHLQNFKKRYEYLMSQNYQRDQLADVLLEQNEKWGLTDEIKKQIEAIRNSDSVVVIGGQQAGILTGPLYTINKIVSILLQAKEQEEFLDKPVVPVFWIAGEDHDFEEINHIFAYQNSRFKKLKLQSNSTEKTPVSNRKIDVTELNNWLDEVFSTLTETSYSKELYQLIKSSCSHDDSYVDFFAKLINQLFYQYGLVLVDSNDSKLREIEKNYFKKIVSKQKAIATSVVNELDELTQQGYQINLDATTEDGHIFYHLNGERLLLEVVDGVWRSKDDLVSFGTDELLSEIDHHPERFSNNVVTRPMMQEMVFPVLSFIGGPGEIGYWSALKPAFEEVDLQFPIITPRLSITFLDSKHKQWLERFGIDISQVINEGTNWYKMNWLKRQTSSPIEEMINQVSQDIDMLHQPVREVAYEIQDDLGSYADSNLKIIKSELNKLEKRMLKEVNDKHKHTIAQFEELNAYYHPERGLQERMWNLIHFMNEFGLELPNLLMSTPRRWEQDHLVIEI